MEKATSFLTARRLHECRLASGETLEQVAALVGVNKTTVMRWENGNTSRISRPALDLLARHFGVTAAWLEGEKRGAEKCRLGRWIEEHALPYGALSEVPILGSVRAGYGGAVFEEITGYEPAPASSLQRDEAYFWLTVTGDSMEPILCEGDLVLVRKTNERGQRQHGRCPRRGRGGPGQKNLLRAGLDRTAQPQSRLCRAAL